MFGSAYGKLVAVAFFALLAVADFVHAETAPSDSIPVQAEPAEVPEVGQVPADTVHIDTSSAEVYKDPSAEHSSSALAVIAWPFTHIFQPILNALVYPIAKPIDYAFKNGIIEKSVDLISFGENNRIMVYPTMNLKPGASTELGVCYRHRNILLDHDYLVMQANYYANSDFDFTLRYTKQNILGSPFYGAVRYTMDWNRDDWFVVPETKTKYLQPDSSYYFEWKTGFPISSSLKWNLEFWTAQKFFNASVPDVVDSVLIDEDFPVEDRGIYQKFMEFPVGFALTYDNLDVPYAPSRGSRASIQGAYHFVSGYSGVNYSDLGLSDDGELSDGGKNHSYITTEFLFQHYFFLGKAKQYVLSVKEARKNRKFYTDFNWSEVVRVWRPENVRQTLFERRVLAVQFREISMWETEKGGAPYTAFPKLNARTPLRGYDDVRATHHLMSLSCEYRWPVDRFVDGVVFDEYAMTASKFDKFNFGNFYNSWGFGVRVRMPDLYLFRVQFGFHGLHGINMVLTIAPEFR